jgi:hypothetical protein
MAGDLTPVMGAEDRRRSEQLSLRGARPPAVLPGYELERPLGEGAFGEVWVALDRNTNCKVAIKFYSQRGGLDWSLLAREVEKLRFLKADRHVVQLLEVGWNAVPPYYVMDYLERGSLEQRLEEGLPSVPETVALVREIATALVHAHAKGVLHCDLKPANVLLDQDDKPRLADFGQARLTQEQSPALGTLFYMAPEQADLKAVPDARWDVYALGAILYRMLVGQPPYRTEQALADIQKAPQLEERLRRYRQGILRAPRPTAHRKARGVDRRLAEIVERCLAVKPEKRFPNAQAVLDALDRRAVQRARRPLLLLGAVGPALLLGVIAFFAWRGLGTAVEDSNQALARRALIGNRFAAEFGAATVARQMNHRWAVLEQEAQDKDLPGLLQRATGPPAGRPQRRPLQEWLERRHKEYRHTTAAKAWFVTGARGELLAVSPLGPSRAWLGKSFAHRSFFHGGDRDYAPEELKGRDVRPIERATLSIVFESSAEDKPRMAVFAVPVRGPSGAPVGVLGMGVVLGDFTELRPEGADDPSEGGGRAGRCAVLVDTRKDWEGQEGLVLQHPWLAQVGDGGRQPPKVRLPAEVVERLKKLRRVALGHEKGGEADALFPGYHDPVADASSEYAGPWLAAAAPVVIQPRKDGERPLDTGWLVLVQERTQDTLGPVTRLRQKLLLQGWESAALVAAILLGLWGLVLLVFNERPGSRLAAFVRRRAGLATGSAPSGPGSLPSTSRSARSVTLPKIEGKAKDGPARDG